MIVCFVFCRALIHHKIVSRRGLTKLSALQKRILEKGLRSFYRTPLDLAGGAANPGCFGLKESPRLDMATGLPLPILDHRERANRRAASGHAIARLVTRGLVESCARGTWRLNASGVKVARDLYPLVKPWSKRELARDIAFREAVHSVGLGVRDRVPGKRANWQKSRGSRFRWIFDFPRLCQFCANSGDFQRICVSMCVGPIKARLTLETSSGS